MPIYSSVWTDRSNNYKKSVNEFCFIYYNKWHYIRKGTQPECTYLDRDTYRLSYERCDICYVFGYTGFMEFILSEQRGWIIILKLVLKW
jgi:hypothetical protein